MNFPLRDGIDDESYEQIFKPVSLLIKRQNCLNISTHVDPTGCLLELWLSFEQTLTPVLDV